MPETKHSPGPWQDCEHSSDDKHDGHLIVDAFGYNVANIWHRQFAAPADRIAEQDSNARLIAAAPELLEALKGFLHADPDVFRAELAAALAAIAKAEGRS